MQKRTLGRTGLDVSIIGLGSAPAAYLATDVAKFESLLNQVLDAGVNLIDTAASYPESEKTLGQLLASRRSEFVLVSKCGSKVPGIDGAAWSDALITATVDRAVVSLGPTPIDVMLLHSCDLATLKKGEAIGALMRAKQAGKIRHIGYSGDNEAAAYAVTLPEIEVLETSINVVDQINIDQALPAAVQHMVGVIVKRPIANAAWKDISQQQGLYKNYAKTYTERFEQMGVKPQDLGFNDWPELALRFTLSQSGVTTAIIGTTNRANAMANLAAAGKGQLDAGVIEQIRAAFKQADPNGQWLGQT